jgi:serine/threonine protein phosphatase PrpC
MVSDCRFKIEYHTDKGRVRSVNEDSLDFALSDETDERKVNFEDLISSGNKGAWIIVADGMGGGAAGEIASKIAVTSIKNSFKSIPPVGFPEVQERFFRYELENAIRKAHDAILREGRVNPSLRGMGTTVCVAWIFQNYLFISWVGDSRIYLKQQNNSLRLLSKDHSYVQQLIDRGSLSEEDAFDHPEKNIITQSLGDPARDPLPGFRCEALKSGDCILLCTDGLNTMLRDREIENKLSVESDNSCSVNLVKSANEQGGLDNITVAIAWIKELAVGNIIQLLTDSASNTVRDNYSSDWRKNIRKYQLPLLLGGLFLIICIIFSYSLSSPKENANTDTQPKDSVLTTHNSSEDNIKPVDSNNNKNIKENNSNSNRSTEGLQQDASDKEQKEDENNKGSQTHESDIQKGSSSAAETNNEVSKTVSPTETKQTVEESQNSDNSKFNDLAKVPGEYYYYKQAYDNIDKIEGLKNDSDIPKYFKDNMRVGLYNNRYYLYIEKKNISDEIGKDKNEKLILLIVK